MRTVGDPQAWEQGPSAWALVLPLCPLLSPYEAKRLNQMTSQISYSTNVLWLVFTAHFHMGETLLNTVRKWDKLGSDDIAALEYLLEWSSRQFAD